MIVRPRRALYTTVELGPKVFRIQNQIFVRKDIHLANSRGFVLKCSWFLPQKQSVNQFPCVIFCHGNCGNRLDALDIVELALASRMTVFCFDFSGSGLSEGDIVSLGYYEKNDLQDVVNYIRKAGVTQIGLWGRSMGAVACIMYAQQDIRLSFIIADSPFYCLRELCINILQKYVNLPRFIGKFITGRLRKMLLEIGGFDIDWIRPVDNIKRIKTPLLLMHCESDQLVPFSHSEVLKQNYFEEIQILLLKQDHNMPRDPQTIQQVLQFISTIFTTPVLSDRSNHTRNPTKIGHSQLTSSFFEALHEINKPMNK